MKTIKLVVPTMEHKKTVMNFRQEFLDSFIFSGADRKSGAFISKRFSLSPCKMPEIQYLSTASRK